MARADTTAVFRFNFDDAVVDAVTEFAKTHEHDCAADYKEAWTLWCGENEELIRMETGRLTGIGYDGDVLDKMYKAGRYYFRTKKTAKTVPKTRRNYISVDGALISKMDEHIYENIKRGDFSPARGFDLFEKAEAASIEDEIARLNEETKDDDVKIEMSQKIKKTYKNRYFILSRRFKESVSS
tara:strand:- start:1308 stop:1856 length:549 start_codon:yes stop_codon:yes gene_type:complete